MTQPEQRPSYLGDSVYVEFEGGMLKLTTQNGDGASNTIYLEDFVYEALLRYVHENLPGNFAGGGNNPNEGATQNGTSS